MIDIDNWNNIINESAIRGYEEELEKKDILLRDKNKEIERLNSTIKEAREYINNSIDYQYIDLTIDSVVEDINEILDKVEENTNGKD